jgi:general secretion pathway protein D
MKHRSTDLHSPVKLLLLACTLLLPVQVSAHLLRPNPKAGGIILNFKHAKIRAVARLISHMTGEDFILDPQIQGNVTVISTQPISPNEVFATFLSVLQVHGFAAVPVAPHLFKIVPALEAHEMPGRIFPRRPIGAPGDSLMTDVLHLHFVNAADLVPVLRSLMGPSAQLSAYPPTNSLIISTRYNNLLRLLRIVREVDEPIGFNIFHLHYASANTVARVLTKLISGQAASGSAPLWIAADERNNSILVRGTPEERLEVRSLIERLDIPVHHGAVGNTEVIHLRYARASSLAKILESYVKAAQSAQQAAKKGARTRRFRAVVVADKSTNSLVITAPLRLMRSIRAVIKKLDIRQAQVLVQAIIAELTTNAAAQLGITWVTDALGTAGTAALTNFSGTGTGVVQVGQAYLGSTSGGVPSSATSTSALSAVPDGLLLGVGRIVQNGLSFAALLNALSSNTSINILSTPSLLAMDNQKAKIQVGQKVPFLTGQYAYSGLSSAGSTASSVVNPFQTIERHEVGITLRIQPQISAGNSVILKIKQKDSTLAPQVSGAIDLITNNRDIETTILVNNRQIIVLGGMISDQISTSKEQVPFLGDIPLLGNLFRYRSTSKQKENLMVFLRPTILRTKAQASYYTRQDYGLIRSYELAHQHPIPLMAGSKRPTLPALTHPPSKATPPHGTRVKHG